MRVGLKPVARRVWAVRGRRPNCPGQTKYEWLYVYGFAHPASGRNLPLILPRADSDWTGAALAEFARWADPDRKKLLVLLVDNAGWHTAKGLTVPANVRLHALPSCTPELQPVEPLWPLVREAAANRSFDDLDALEDRLARRCRWLIEHPETVKAAVGFRWAAKLR